MREVASGATRERERERWKAGAGVGGEGSKTRDVGSGDCFGSGTDIVSRWMRI